MGIQNNFSTCIIWQKRTQNDILECSATKVALIFQSSSTFPPYENYFGKCDFCDLWEEAWRGGLRVHSDTGNLCLWCWSVWVCSHGQCCRAVNENVCKPRQAEADWQHQRACNIYETNLIPTDDPGLGWSKTTLDIKSAVYKRKLWYWTSSK